MMNTNNNLIEKEENKIKNIINWKGVVFVIIVLAVLGFSYFRNNKGEDSGGVEDTDVILSEDEVKTNEPTSSTEPTVANPVVNTVDAKKFNDLLTNGSKAFIAKNYEGALSYYNQALSLKDSDLVYIRLFDVYNVQNNITKAQDMLNMAINKNPSYTDYWDTKLIFLDERTNTSFSDLKKIYNEGLIKIDPRTKINLITTFARIAESNKEYAEAIALFTYAKQELPENAAIYQQEIDRINAR